MANLTPEQLDVIRRSLARAKGVSPRVRKALLLAEGVESNYRDLDYGDRDSTGVLQQRPSQGWGPDSESLETDVDQFLARATKANRGFRGSAGKLAQTVQRSAFPERYDQRSGEVEAILARLGGVGRGRSSSAGSGDEMYAAGSKRERGLALLQYLQNRHEPGALQGLIGALGTEKSPPTDEGRGASGTGNTASQGSTTLEQIARMAVKRGLSVREYEPYDKVDPVHTKGSHHYSNAAADISGDPKKLRAFARLLARRFGPDLEELFHDHPSVTNLKNGRPTRPIGGHGTHVHVADRD